MVGRVAELSHALQNIRDVSSNVEDKMRELSIRVENRSVGSVAGGQIPSDLSQQVRQLVETHLNTFNERMDTKTGTFEGIANTLHRELDKVITAIEKLDRHRRQFQEQNEINVSKITALERKVSVKETEISELQLKVSKVLIFVRINSSGGFQQYLHAGLFACLFPTILLLSVPKLNVKLLLKWGLLQDILQRIGDHVNNGRSFCVLFLMFSSF